jgi:hypothetical protein
MGTLTKHYRPELHYMRGPGPKWLEKHPEYAESTNEDSGQGVGELCKAKGWREVVLARLRALNAANQ